MRLVLGLIGALLCAPALALDPARSLDQYGLDSFQSKDGLPQNSVQAIAETPDGYLWLGTQEGLVRFDGLRFAVFDRANTPALANNHVTALLPSPAGLWVGTFGGDLIEWRGRPSTLRSIPLRPQAGAILSLSMDHEGRLWIATSTGLYLRTGERVERYGNDEGLPSDQTRALLTDLDGTLWVGTSRGLVRMRDGTIAVTTERDGLPGDDVLALARGPDGALWAGTSKGLARLDGRGWRAFRTRDGLAHDSVRTLHVDPQGTLWIGTAGGLTRFREGAFASVTTRDGLTSDSVAALYTDREGSLWIGTDGGGLSRLKEAKAASYGLRQGLSNELVYAVAGARDGGMWVGTYGGDIDHLRDGRFTPTLRGDRLGSTRVRALLESRDGGLWIGTDLALHRYAHGRVDTFQPDHGLAATPVRVVYQDRQGTVWVGTDGGGLLRASGSRLVPDTRPGLPSNQVRAILEDARGGFWVGTYAGLAVLRDGRYQTYTTAQGLSHDYVRCLHESADGTLWIGTYGGGLTRLKDGRFTAVTSRDGLFSDVVFRILEDAAGDLWMSCNKGVFRVKRGELDEFAAGTRARVHSEVLDEADGMRSRECSGGSPGGWRTADGRLWFPTVQGVVAVDPSRLPRNPAAPPVVLERMSADSEDVDLSAPARLPPRRQRLEFAYTALSFVAPERIRYRYRLVGFDQAWVDAGTGHQAVYTRLPPGSYRFRVVAANADGAWNESGAVYAFELAPSFYETAWFWTLAALALALAAVGLHLWRVRRLQRHEETLQQRIQEAVAQIKVLSGLLPICAGCKNVRDDRGYWNRIEVYIRERSEAEFTHGLCPACLRKLYPEFAERVLAMAEEEPSG
jgi:ligand-binding sensor domain-containing protein